MEIINIESLGLEFKNLVSGPAPVGRILNYIFLAGNNKLKHQNGYRSLDLKNNIGSAWATEFMIGLGLLKLGDSVNDSWILELTKRGKIIFDIISTDPIEFDEGTSINSIENVERQMQRYGDKLKKGYFEAFISSAPYAILKNFLLEYGFFYSTKSDFMEPYFAEVKKMYDSDPTPYIVRGSGATTAANRVPSIMQLCMLFGFLKRDSSNCSFNRDAFIKYGPTDDEVVYSCDELKESANNETEFIKQVENLIDRFGEDGNVLISAIVRNSELQRRFKHNLMIEQKSSCVMCGLKTKELLIGSHILPSAESDVNQKVDHNNGLLLCCNHDKLFDRYLITFNFLDGKIEISKTIAPEDYEILLLDPDFALPEGLLTPERSNYLMEHNYKFNNLEADR